MAKTVDVSALPTRDIERVAIMAAGGPYKGKNSAEGGDHFDADKLNAIAEANNALADELHPPNKIGHNPEQKLAAASFIADDEMPALGWLRNFRVEDNHDGRATLFADAKRVPEKFGALIEAGVYPKRSVEVGRVTAQKDGTEKTYDAAIVGLAWLGAKAPAIRTIDDVYKFFGEGDPVWKPGEGYMARQTKLMEAANGGTGEERFWVMDFTDNKVILSEYATGQAFVAGYRERDGACVLDPSDEWQAAEQSWVEAASDRASTYADAVPERTTPGDTSQQMKGKDTNADSTPTLTDEQITQFAGAFGIEEDDETKRREAVIAKFAEHAPAVETPPVKPKEDDPVEEQKPAALPEGMIAMSAAELEVIKAKADAGAAVAESARVEKRDRLIGTAIREGRVDPAKKDFWEQQFNDNLIVAETLISEMPVNPELVNVFGDDSDPLSVDSDDFEKQYATYAEATGVRRAQREGAVG